MRVLVYPTDLDVGGAVTNALDLAGAVRDRGHEIVVFAPPGPMQAGLADRGLEWIPALPHPRGRLSWAQVRRLNELARRLRPDVVHSWEFASSVNALLALRLPYGVGLVCTVMSMRLSRFVPRHSQLTMGTEDLCRTAVRTHRGPVHLLEPPLDVAAEQVPPEAGADFRRQLAVADSESLVVVVSRLTPMKRDGIAAAIRADGAVAAVRPARLAIVGDGPLAGSVARLADEVNNELGRPAVLLAGVRQDPRPAYAAADVVVGMGSSVLRGMSAGKPAIVVGLDGFVRAVRPDTWDHFDRHGMWGVGPDRDSGSLAEELSRLLAEATARASLGSWGRQLVTSRYDLSAAAGRLESIYRAAAAQPRSAGEWVDVGHVLAGSAVYSSRPLIGRVRGWRRSPASSAGAPADLEAHDPPAGRREVEDAGPPQYRRSGHVPVDRVEPGGGRGQAEA
jgi:glycosyltransferase involved in cell wall biosynthesis